MRLRPDLSVFQTELQAGVTRAVAGITVPPVRVPVQTVAAAAGGTDIAQQAQAAAAGAAAQQAATSSLTTALRGTRAETLAARAAAAQLVAEQTRVATSAAVEAGAMTELAAAQRQATAFQAAATQATRALAIAQAQGATAAASQATATLAAAEAARTDAVAQTADARAAAANAVSHEALARGAGASALSLLGVRGATLAANAPFLAGAAAVAVFAKSLGSFADFERTLNVFQATTGATADEMERVGEAARALGADLTLPAVTAGDAAEAMSQLARAGLTVEQSISAARGVLQLATAAQIDNATATALVANSLNAFSLAGEDAVHVADLLANAANAAQGEITDFGQGMAQVAAVASQVGVSLEDTTALLTLLARAGLRGSDAGTSLRTAFLRLAAPTREGRETIRALGLEVRNLQGEVRPEVFAEFAQATQSLAPDLRDAAAAAVFGQDAIRAAVQAGRQGIEGLRDVQDQVARQGTAADLARAQTEGLAGAAEGLSSQLQTLGGTLGGVVAPPLEFFITILSRGVGTINDFATALRNIDFGPLGGFLEDVVDRTQIDEVADEARDSAGVFSRAMGSVADSINNLPGLGDLRGQITDFGTGVDQVVDKAAALEDAFQRAAHAAGEIAEGARLSLQAAADAERARLAELGQSLSSALTLLERLGGVDATGGAADAARQEIEKIIEQLERLGPEGRAVLQAQADQLVPALTESLREAAAQFTGIGDLARTELPDAMRETIRRLAALGPAGRAQLRALGAELAEGLAEGITDNDDAIAAARRSVARAVEAAAEQVQSSVRQARGNLETLGSSVARALGDIIEEAPVAGAQKALASVQAALEGSLRVAQRDLREAQEAFATIGTPTPEQLAAQREALDPLRQAIADRKAELQEFKLEGLIDEESVRGAGRSLDDLRAALERLQDQGERRRLDFGLREAERDLRDAQEAFTIIGEPTAEQRAAQAEFLDPFKQAVADAKAQTQEFSLENLIDEQEDAKEAAQRAAEEGVARLVDQFQSGRLSAEEFASALRAQVQPALAALPKTNLGFTFTRDFMRNVETLIKQAQELSGFLGTAGTTPGPQAVNIRATAEDAQDRIADARRNLQEQLTANKNTEKNTREANALLKEIRDALKRPAPRRRPIQDRNLNVLEKDPVVPTNKTG